MPDFYTSIALTGVTPTIVDHRGRLYLSQVDDTGGYFHTDIYNDSGLTSLVGHTATYNTNGAKAVVADGGSGLGGTVTVSSLAARAGVVASYYRYGIVSALTASLMTVHGPALNAGTCPYLWYGNPERVLPLVLNIPGEYALSTEVAALRARGAIPGIWLNRRAHLARYGITAAGVGAGDPPKINFIIADTTTSTENSGAGASVSGTPGELVWTTTYLDPRYLVSEYDGTFEIAVTTTTNDPDDQYLSVLAQLVLE